MNRFKPVIIDRANGKFFNIKYLTGIMFLYLKHADFLDDDFACGGKSFFKYFIGLVERVNPFFWAIVDGENIAGFVYLDNIIGSSEVLHCAELTTCFGEAYRGSYAKDSAELFLKYCFEVLGFKKIKTLVYPENFRAKALLKLMKFEKEGTLKSETQRHGKPQDIEVYGAIAPQI